MGNTEKKVMSGPDLMEWTQEFNMDLEDCHYNGDLIPGSRIMGCATDCAATLTVRRENDAALLAAADITLYDSVYVGDHLEVVTTITHVGNRSRKIEYTVHKTIKQTENGEIFLETPVLVAKGNIVAVVKKPLPAQN